MKRVFILQFFALFLITGTVNAQLDQTFKRMFDGILVDGLVLSAGPHADHYRPAAAEAEAAIVPALNSLIGGNISSFPSFSSVAAVAFDWSTGIPVPVSSSRGPIFAENSETIGLGSAVIGINASSLSLDRLRGVPVNDLRFSFLHQDVVPDGKPLGDNSFELDVIDVFPQLNIDATVVTFFGSYGITRTLDVGLAVPFVRVSLSGNSSAVVNSRTFSEDGVALHVFGGTGAQPILGYVSQYDESAAGIGDITLRVKYRLPVEVGFASAVLVDVRLPTGSEEDFLGSGATSVRTLLVASHRLGGATPHINVGYDYRGAKLDSDEFELLVGIDQRVIDELSIAVDFIGEFDIQRDEGIHLLPESEYLVETGPGGTATIEVDRSNVPDSNFDHSINASIGVRIAPSDKFQIVGNVLIPMQNGGLRSSVASTVGVSITL